MEQEFRIRYTVTYERVVRSVGLEAAAEHAKRAVNNIVGAKLLLVYDPAVTKLDPIA